MMNFLAVVASARIRSWLLIVRTCMHHYSKETHVYPQKQSTKTFKPCFSNMAWRQSLIAYVVGVKTELGAKLEVASGQLSHPFEPISLLKILETRKESSYQKKKQPHPTCQVLVLEPC